MTARRFVALGMIIAVAFTAAPLSHGQDDEAAGKRRNGGSLGIFVREQQPGVIEIERVHPGGGADRAGLQAGDIVQSIDGRSLRNGDQLIRRLWSSRPFALTLKRDGETVRIRTSTAQLDVFPRVGDQAPDFTLKLRDGEGTATLADMLEADRPVVLVFGSFT